MVTSYSPLLLLWLVIDTRSKAYTYADVVTLVSRRTPTRGGGEEGPGRHFSGVRHFWWKEGIANGLSRLNLKLDLGLGIKFWLRLDLPKVARRPWAPRTVVEFPIKTRYVLDSWKTCCCPWIFSGVIENSWIAFKWFIFEILIALKIQESRINNVIEQNKNKQCNWRINNVIEQNKKTRNCKAKNSVLHCSSRCESTLPKLV